MNVNALPRLRQDIKITEKWKPETQTKRYLIENPISGETFEFGEEELFLYQSLDGSTTPEEIITRFRQHFSSSITLDDIDQFFREIAGLGLLDASQAKLDGSILVSEEDIDEDDDYDDDLLLFAPELKEKDWNYVFNSEKFFDRLAAICKSTGISMPQFVWGLTPLAIIAIWMWFKHWDTFLLQREIVKSGIGFLGSVLVFLIAENFLGKCMKGTTAAADGAKVNKFAMHLRWYFIPRFHIKISGLGKLSREQQMWIQGAPLVNRAILFVIGTFVADFNLGKETTLTSWGIVFAALGMFTFLHDSFPLRYRSAGNKITCLYFHKPARYARQVIKRSLKAFFSMIKSLWSNSSRGEVVGLSIQEVIFLLLGLFIIFIEVYIAIDVVDRFSIGLSKVLPEFFGIGTYHVFQIILGSLAIKYMTRGLFKSSSQVPILGNQNLESQRKFKNFLNWKAIFLFALVVILCLPVPYSPGGTIQLLPPKQQPIQAPISGQIVKVFFNGGDGKLIKAQTIIAKITSYDLTNEINGLQEQLKEQQANLEQQKANLKKLVAGSTKEEIDVSRQDVEIAEKQLIASKTQVRITQKDVDGARSQGQTASKEVEIAKKQLESAIITSKYSQEEVPRLQGLYESGAFGLQQLEEAKKTAETDKVAIEESRENLAAKESALAQANYNLSAKQALLEQEQQNVETSQKNLEKAQAQLKLVLSGSRPEDIEASRHQVEMAQSEVRGLEQNIQYDQDKSKSTDLLMPFNGYLVDSYLNKKLGSFINQGDTFAMVEDGNELVVELELPEYDASEIAVGNKAELKLLAYPDRSIRGQVISIEPASTSIITTGDTTSPSTTTDSYRFFKVIIKPTELHGVLKPGMSGYGKVEAGKKPLIVALTRPLVRFIEVELWSWLP
jgi:putative peptide zinc metalloprotease protein